MKPFLLALAAATALLLTGCGSTPLSPTGQLALETSVRIAVRHSIAGSDRAAEKAHNIRNIVERVRAEVSEDWTIATITAELSEEIERLGLDPIAREDAYDLLQLLTQILEERIGAGDLKPDGVVKVQEFADLVLGALPVI